jgi:hypothetical protein
MGFPKNRIPANLGVPASISLTRIASQEGCAEGAVAA